jgi:hypothetical protein
VEIREIEGDAVFALGPNGALLPPAQLLNVFDSAFAAFKETQRKLAADESCSCGACRSVERLDLKIAAHHGRFLRHAVGGRGQVVGVDVIFAHRLLKNGVTTSRAYVLVTDALLARLGLDSEHGDQRRDRGLRRWRQRSGARTHVGCGGWIRRPLHGPDDVLRRPCSLVT